ncbi:unnamed protein product [Fraxinus pennsylvanica]|uniref:Zinc knuckle CX2CX4HX4C domain-containing protein n=1 Tax=Fraxinus pennsylvanica TaxID=56036 RepID=A0AAD2DP70_9LAMI|nr:unnamed protein product [Fraxinus pennsylvanica]
MQFDVAALWVQFHNLPFAGMSRETGIKLGSSMGNVEDVEVDEDDVGWGSSLRVKIALNLRKPLARGRMVMLEGVKTWVPIQYEKLPWFCIKCGRIIHEQAGCPKSLDLNMGAKQYGSWLRAEVGNRKFRAFPTSGTKPPAMNFDTTEKKRVEEGGAHDGIPVPYVANQATGITVVNSEVGGMVLDVSPKHKELTAENLELAENEQLNALNGGLHADSEDENSNKGNVLCDKVIGPPIDQMGLDQVKNLSPNAEVRLGTQHELKICKAQSTWKKRARIGTASPNLLTVAGTKKRTNGASEGESAEKKLKHGFAAYSDHTPISLFLLDDLPQRRGAKIFWFEAMWVTEKGCKEVVEKAWRFGNATNGMSGINAKLKCCGEHLSAWNRQHFGNVHKQLKHAKISWNV